tara:strand:+ start:5424 stop:5696 length:273 start_codon:yes stop_codon:yes gene_type:complete
MPNLFAVVMSLIPIVIFLAFQAVLFAPWFWFQRTVWLEYKAYKNEPANRDNGISWWYYWHYIHKGRWRDVAFVLGTIVWAFLILYVMSRF